MTEQSDLWDAVKASYDADGLIQLTNINDPAATSVDDTIGTRAAVKAIALWDIYAQVDYDGANATHLAVAEEAVIAVLWRWGGTSSEIERVKWDSVFGPDGMVAQVRVAGPRGWPQPKTSSKVTPSDDLENGKRTRPWADRDALPSGILPDRRTV